MMEDIRDALPTDAAPQAAVETETVPAEPQAPAPTAEDGIRVRYNHEDRQLTAQEAAVYAQKGMKLDALADRLGEDTLRRLPGLAERLKALAATGGRTLPELIDALADAADRRRLTELTDACGGNAETAARLLAYERAGRDEPEQPTRITPAPPSLEERLAEEFLVLRDAVPEITTLRDVPTEALELSAAEGVPLVDAYLRHRLAEQQRIEQARLAAEAAAAASAGRQSDGGRETADPVMEAVLRGIWER